MDIRSLQHNASGGIDLEFDHPQLGWIPCSTHPDDEPTAYLYYAALDSGLTVAELDEAAALAKAIAAAIAKTYTDVDAVYVLAVGSREPEYRDAEAAAREYQAAGYTGTASPYISGWASSQTPPLTDQEAADAIIAKADALATAKIALRNTRFTAQAALRAATTQAELDAAVAAWGVFIAQVRTSLGL
jgi:hypothetical protein